MSFSDKLKDLQQNNANRGWRIPYIAHAKDGELETLTPLNLPGWLALVGLAGIPTGFYIIVDTESLQPGMIILALSVVWTIACILLRNRWRKRGWVQVQAQCIDKDIKRLLNSGAGRAWDARILCEFEHDGATVRCTPRVYWSTFKSEGLVMQFLEERIGSDGRCTLLINPKIPQQSQLIKPE